MKLINLLLSMQCKIFSLLDSYYNKASLQKLVKDLDTYARVFLSLDGVIDLSLRESNLSDRLLVCILQSLFIFCKDPPSHSNPLHHVQHMLAPGPYSLIPLMERSDLTMSRLFLE